MGAQSLDPSQPCVYVIRTKGREVVKIGLALDPVQRLNALQTGCPDKLELMAIRVNSSKEEEKDIHGLFEKHRLTGEWFTLSQEIVDFIDTDCISYSDYKKLRRKLNIQDRNAWAMSFRLKPLTVYKLKRLSDKAKKNKTQILVALIDGIYDKEFGDV